MQDQFGFSTDSITAPSRDAFAITPSDSGDLDKPTKAIYVGTGGNVTVRTIGSETDVTFVNVQNGAILDIRCRAVRNSGTTAGDIVGLA